MLSLFIVFVYNSLHCHVNSPFASPLFLQKTPWNLWLCSTYTWPKRGTYQRGLLPKKTVFFNEAGWEKQRMSGFWSLSGHGRFAWCGEWWDAEHHDAGTGRHGVNPTHRSPPTGGQLGKPRGRQVQSRISEELKQREVPLTTRRDHSNLIFLKVDLNTYMIYLYVECK